MLLSNGCQCSDFGQPFKGETAIMNKCLEELDRLQRKRQKLYESYQREEIDAQDYLLAIHPLDHAIDRLEISFLFGKLKRIEEVKPT